MINIKFKMMENCENFIPKKAHHDDAAYDLQAREEVLLPVGKTTLVKTGLSLELPIGYEAQIRPRSGLALKHSLTLVNSPGTIDAGYRGEVGIIMMNMGNEDYTIKKGERAAQMVICKLPDVELELVDDLSDTNRGEGGFGSSGKH